MDRIRDFVPGYNFCASLMRPSPGKAGPLFGSMRLHFVLMRFGTLSLMTALLDNAVFYFCYHALGNILAAQAIGRTVAVLFNYTMAKQAVFLSEEQHRATLPKYLMLVVSSGAVSYGLINILHAVYGMPVIWAKLLAESGLFIANFAIQRVYVFARSKREAD